MVACLIHRKSRGQYDPNVAGVFSSILGEGLGAIVIVVAAKAGLWGGVVGFPIILLSSTGVLYLWLEDSGDNDKSGAP